MPEQAKSPRCTRCDAPILGEGNIGGRCHNTQACLRRAAKVAAIAVVGRAFRGSDGLVRWVTHLSTRNYYSLLWLNEPDGLWHSGGIVKVDKWEGGVEVQAPQPGERYRRVGATGVTSEYTVESAEDSER